MVLFLYMNNKDSRKINKEAKEIANIIAKKYNPEKIILFGSVARGEARKYSDIDLCIIKNTRLPLRKRIWRVYKLIRGYNYNYGVEPIVFTPKEFKDKREIDNYFVRNIIKDGKILYDAKR